LAQETDFEIAEIKKTLWTDVYAHIVTGFIRPTQGSRPKTQIVNQIWPSPTPAGHEKP